ncbi:MAG: T9SS type A sorting domain-containing protein [Bacteroidales bacterium]|nr:T9SS type A sorting domain-containing protein [Bacteroidales bacterium]
MKKIKIITQKSWPLILALIFLCSCYEIVYITQDKDVRPFSSIKTKVCINVVDDFTHPKDPYFGVLMPVDWKVKPNIPYSYQLNGLSYNLGVINYSLYYSKQMQKIDPAPEGYIWWVGVGNTPIANKGIYNAYPDIITGKHTGDYQLEYMLGDSFNGLNFLRSEKKDTRIISSRSASDLTARSDNKSIHLQWKAPTNNIGLVGYDIYRNNYEINNAIVQDLEYEDTSVRTGSYSYKVVPVYLHGKSGIESVPANICFAHQGTSMDFDGKNDRIIIFNDPSLQVEHMLTMEVWIKLKDSESYQPRIISKGTSETDYELFLNNVVEGYNIAFSLNSGILQSKTPLTAHNWYHVAATYDGIYMKLYINGELDCQRKIYGHINSSNSPLYIGRNSSSVSNYFCGDIDEVRVWNYCRTEQQISSYDSRNLTGQENGLVGYWQMKEGCSFTTCDLSKENNNGYLQGSCWCSEEFPYVEETNSMTNPGLMVPIMNYNEMNRKPNKIEMEFKINPKLLEFQGINKQFTQIEHFSKVMTQYSPDGTIRIIALNYNHTVIEGDILVYLDFKSLQKKVNTTLEFQTCKTDGALMRTMSGKIIADAAGIKSENLTDIDTRQHSISVNVFPNPAKNYLNVEISNTSNAIELQIINIVGQVVYSEKIAMQNVRTVHKIDISQLNKGLYIINLLHENEMSVKKFAIH